jgi:putative membrane protein
MRRASSFFTAEQRRQVAEAVARAESRTAAEIVPVVATASGRYERAEDVVGLWFGLALMAATWTLLPRASEESGAWPALPRWAELLALVVASVVGFLLGVVVANRVARLRRCFSPRAEQHHEVDERAREVFFDRRIGHTTRHTGLLLYVSLFERRAVVLADDAVQQKLGPTVVQELCATLTSELRSTDPATALVRAVDSVGARLAAELPRAADDVDEIPDALVLID